MHVIYRRITYVFGMFVQLQENRMEMENGNRNVQIQSIQNKMGNFLETIRKKKKTFFVLWFLINSFLSEKLGG